MFHNTKLLVATCLLLIISGFGFLWYGLSPKTLPNPSPIPSVENIPESTSSTTLTAGSSTVASLESEQVLVTKVIDGDTVELENGSIVRLLGIDTPETKDPRKPVQCFGKEASAETKDLIEGKFVILEKDISETDKYDRLLRYIFLPLENNKLLFINDYLIREGFARVLTYPPDVKYTEQFLQVQIEAKENRRGLWQKCL